MFTGLVTAIGSVSRTVPVDGGLEMTVASPWSDLAIGESVAWTAPPDRHRERGTASMCTSSRRRRAHRIRDACRGTGVNSTGNARWRSLGGHWCGPVDGWLGRRDRPRARRLSTRRAAAVVLLVALGSVTVDGVSLTAMRCRPNRIQVALIPFTLQHTTLGERRPGDRVHVEGDAVGKYVRQMLDAQRPRGEG